MNIEGKTAVITGGASGLGAATARRFVSLGGKAAIFDLNDELGSALASELGDGVSYHHVDVADEASVASAIQEVLSRFGAMHVCCNYAGIGTPGRTVGRDGPLPLDWFKRVINVNLIGTFNVIRLTAAEMIKQEPVTQDGCRGVIINTASVAAYEGQIGQAAYSASKGGVVGMTLPIARDLASMGVRVNTIVPGLIDTPMMAGLPEPARESLAASVLFPKRLGKADEIAQLAQAIVENDYLNGECIRMDGGIRMQPK
ncbi:MAG: SDR family oxidoreductase [Gammaproteobacteria bacterium]|jgi:3-hydroxyacyl-CoA dehydrogenase/3-hydroxy-2-methylbutyryl-CoA dehydrogenase